MAKFYRALGLMSGTSLDGIDAALIETDGKRLLAAGPTLTQPYDEAFRGRLKAVLGAEARTPDIDALEEELTDRHAFTVGALLEAAGMTAADIDLVGFHGQTINHRPDRRWTWQLGLGDRLAAAVGIDTVFDLRGADVAAEGEGAPLAPVYHRALSQDLLMPLAVLNLGGVANLTYLASAEADPVAFDTGPASALLDDWIARHGAGAMDTDGTISTAGQADAGVLAELMDHVFFDAPYPKSLDRNDFDSSPVDSLNLEDGAATLAAFTIETVTRGVALLPGRPQRLLVTGGGRRNPTLMKGLAARLSMQVEPVEAVGWDGDALEAQAFAFLAVRSQMGLPITFPGTTGISEPLTGGRFAPAT